NHITTSTIPAVVQSRKAADQYSILGGSIAIRLRGEHTDGQLGLIEQVVPAGFPGPALHVHPDFDESFYVIDGELAFRGGGAAHLAGPGTLAYIPRGTPHTFANPGGRAARALVIFSPAGFERYFEALVDAVDRAGGIPAAAELIELGIVHGSVPVPAVQN